MRFVLWKSVLKIPHDALAVSTTTSVNQNGISPEQEQSLFPNFKMH